MVKKLYLMSGLSIFCFPLAYIYMLFLNIRDLCTKEYTVKNSNILGRVIILCAFAIVILFSRYKFISIKFSLLYILAMSVYTYFDKYNFEIDVEKYLQFIINCTSVVLIIGIIMYIFPIESMPLKWVDLSQYNINNRMFATFFNPNIYAYYLAVIMIVIASINNNKNEKQKIWNNIVYVISCICLYFTYSRTSWFTVIFVMIIMALISRKQYLIYALISICIMILAESIFKSNRANLNMVVTDSSFQYRLELWRISFEIIKDNLFFGIGVGTFYKYTASYSDIVVKYIEHCHNVYLQIIMSMGILPISIVIVFYVKSWFDNIKKLLVNRKSSFASMSIAVIIFSMFSSIFDAVLLTPQIFLLMVIILVIVKKSSNNLIISNY